MGKIYDVKITKYAEAQLREIARYIAFDLRAPGTALQMLNTLETEIASLNQMPNRISLTEEEPWRSEGIHKIPVKNYLVYFWVDEEAAKVQVIGVVYARRDQRRQLELMEME